MLVAVGWLALTAWWLGIAVLVLVIIPVVVLIANRIVSATRVISVYAEDIADHAGAVAAALESVDGLQETRRLAAELHERARRLSGAAQG